MKSANIQRPTSLSRRKKHIRKQQQDIRYAEADPKDRDSGGMKKQRNRESVERQSMSLKASALATVIRQRRNMLALHHQILNILLC